MTGIFTNWKINVTRIKCHIKNENSIIQNISNFIIFFKKITMSFINCKITGEFIIKKIVRIKKFWKLLQEKKSLGERAVVNLLKAN